MDDQPTKDNNKSGSLAFTSDDIKLLVITFAGTVAANLITVLFVGLAIVLVHIGYAHHHPELFVLTLIALTIMATIGVVLLFRIFSYRRKRGFHDYNPAKWLLAAPLVFGVILLLLFWVGVASGIK